jgi:peptide/nickel transport system substrate-binding protein
MDSGSSNSSLQLVYAVISQQLAAVGIRAEIVSHEHSAWLALRNSGEMDAFVARWGMDYNDPANIMYTFFGNENNSKARSANYADKAIIARVSAARSIVDDAAREAEYQALEKQLIEEDVVWVPMYAELHLWAIGDRVAAFTPHWAGWTDFFVSDFKLK